MSNDANNITEILTIANSPDLKETGGGHNQKGVDFQRYWALMRIFDVEASCQDDFLFLFEAIQDVAEFDSSVTPSSVTVYQVKKKDRGEWDWGGLTNLPSPKRKKQTAISPERLSKTKSSPIGKLYATVIAFTNMHSRGHFISNAGCDLTLVGGGNAATSVPCSLASLDPVFHALLEDGLKQIHKAGMPAPDLGRIKVEHVGLHPDNMGDALVGKVMTFLHSRSPRHSGQAKSLVDSLMAKIGPLGAKTDKCNTFEEMKGRHGFTRKDLTTALGSLEEVPDIMAFLNIWLETLAAEGMDAMNLTAMKMATSAYYRRQVMGSHTDQERALVTACDEWLAKNSQSGTLRQFFEEASTQLSRLHPTFRKPELLAIFALRAITKCVAQT